MMYWDGNGGGGWAVMMVLIMLLFWGGIIALVWYAIRSLQRPATGSHNDPDPRSVLDVRLARGEIEPEEYQQRVALLEGRR